MLYLYFLLIFTLVLAVFLIVFVVSVYSITKKNCENNIELNKKIDEYLLQKNIPINKIIYVSDYWTSSKSNENKKKICVSTEMKKVALVDYDKQKLYVVDFDKIVNFEIYENGSTRTIGAGVAGVGSGLAIAESSGNCKDLRLIIRINKIEVPQVTYDIVSKTLFNVGLNKSSDSYRVCMSSLQEIVSLFEIIKHKNKLEKAEN